jgi:two-component system sensor histidine kinase EvgS
MDGITRQETPAIRALVVDDDAASLSITCHMLRTLGLHADTAKDGIEALDRVNHCVYDLVVSDLQMPGIDGFSLTCRLKNKTRNMKSVIMTGLSPDEVVDYMETGIIDSWIFKPFTLNELSGVVKVCVPS